MIAPQTDVSLLNTVLENDGVNTLTWDSEVRQRNYFISCRVFILTDFLYQRQDRAIKVELPIDTLYGNVNYVMYRNTAYSSKWFYAFIDRLEYINDNTTLVYIRTDEFQTWQFDISYRTSFVVREHTNNDAVGANRLDEGLGLGNYVCEKKETMWNKNALPRIAMLAPLNVNTVASVTVTGSILQSNPVGWLNINYEKFYNNTGYNSYACVRIISKGTAEEPRLDVELASFNTEADARTYNFDLATNVRSDVEPSSAGLTFNSIPELNHQYNCAIVISAVQTGGTITTESYASYMSHNIMGYNFQSGALNLAVVQGWLDKLNAESLSDDVGALYLIPPSDCGNPETRSNGVVSKQTKTFTLTRTLDGYTPKNNKLLCYPYTIVKMHNASDGRRVLAPELFYTYGNCGFEFWSSFQPGCTVISVPLNYAGVAESLEYALNSAKFPLSAARYNGFQNWMGIHATERNIRIAGGIFNSAMGILPFLAGGVGTGGEIGDMFYSMSAGASTRNHNNSNRYRNGSNRRVTSSVGTSMVDSLSTSGNTMTPYSRIRGLGSSVLSIASVLAEDNARQNERFGTIGTIDNNNLNAVNNINIYLEQQTITYDYARRIDDYFSMYGYKTNMLKVPNVIGRRNWNFVQLRNANVVGAIPNDSLENIRAMLLHGVTFWHNPNTYLDYSQNNDII